MNTSRATFVLVLATACIPSTAVACLWDYDTLLQERSRFPTALEIITGKFLRHSPEFYEWRIKDRLTKLKADPDNFAYRDDLAVAYDKTGQHEKAIAVMLESAALKPNRYETEANLGTFYIHAGQLDKSLPHIDNALRINPDAHFGRERYQRWLVEYVLECQEGKAEMPLPLLRKKNSQSLDYHEVGFLPFLQKKTKDFNRQEAVTGILGMMRFANYESPLLLEALANVLSRPTFDESADAKRLAARAYLKASYVAANKDQQAAYRELAKQTLQMQTQNPAIQGRLTLETLEADFKRELAEADAWWGKVRADELAWIKQGRNPEEAFVSKYYEQPAISTDAFDYASSLVGSPLALVCVIGLALAGLILVLGLRRRQRTHARRCKEGQLTST